VPPPPPPPQTQTAPQPQQNCPEAVVCPPQRPCSDVANHLPQPTIERIHRGGIYYSYARFPTADEISLYPAPKNWLMELPSREYKWLSEMGQDGIIEEIFKNIGTTNKFYVEFGFKTPSFNTEYANVRNLHLTHGWRGLLMDGGNENPDINLHQHLLSYTNIVPLFKQYGVPTELDYLSIDVDSIDLWLMKALLEGGYRPRAMQIEYNCHFPYDSTITHMEEWTPYPGTLFYGVALGAVRLVAEQFNYTIVHVVSKFDAFMIRNDLIRGYEFLPFRNYMKDGNLRMHVKGDLVHINNFIDYSTWDITRDEAKAKQVAATLIPMYHRMYGDMLVDS